MTDAEAADLRARWGRGERIDSELLEEAREHWQRWMVAAQAARKRGRR